MHFRISRAASLVAALFVSSVAYSDNSDVHTYNTNPGPITKIDTARAEAIAKYEQHRQKFGNSSRAFAFGSCISGPLPSTPRPPVFSLSVVDPFTGEADKEFQLWREPCPNNPDESEILIRVTPAAATTEVCPFKISIKQNGRSYFTDDLFDSTADIGNCKVFDAPTTLRMPVSEFNRDLDLQEAFIFKNLYGGEISIPSAYGVTPSHPLVAYNVPSAQNADQATLHFINRGQQWESVIGTLYHQDGDALGLGNSTIIENLAPGARVSITAKDLEGLIGTQAWSKRSRLEALATSENVDLLVTVRAQTGTTTNLTCTNSQFAHNIPGSLNRDKAFIRLSNTTDETIKVRASLFHQEGDLLGVADTVIFPALAPKATEILTAEKLESLFNVGPWGRRSRLEITSNTAEVELMGLIRTGGTLTNMSCASSSTTPNIPSTENSDLAFLRVTNTSAEPAGVLVDLTHQDGHSLSGTQATLIGNLNPRETRVFSVGALEQQLNVGPWSKRARMQVVGDTSQLSMLNLIRSPSDILTNMSCFNNSSAYYIPSSKSADKAFVRITNTSGKISQLGGNLYDQNGDLIGIQNFLIEDEFLPNQTIVVNAASLELLTGGDTWDGLARLEITVPSSGVQVLNLLRNDNNTLTNLSCSVKRLGQYAVVGSIAIPSGLIQDSDTNDTNALGIDNSNFPQAQMLGNPFVVQGYVGNAGSGAAGAVSVNGDPWDVFQVNLSAGQTIKIETADAGNDLDILLYNARRDLLDSTASSSLVETLNVPEDGSYYIAVNSYSGASNYILTVENEAIVPSNYSLRLSQDFVPGEIIAKTRALKGRSQMTSSTRAQFGLNTRAQDPHGTQLLSIKQQSGRGARQALQRSKLSAPSLPGSNVSAAMQLKLDTLVTIKALRKSGEISWAEPNYVRRASSITADEYSDRQWHYSLINLPQAWNSTTGSSDVVVAVAQRRQRNREHREAVHQVFTERAGFDTVLGLAVRGGDDAHVDLLVLLGPKPTQCPGL